MLLDSLTEEEIAQCLANPDPALEAADHRVENPYPSGFLPNSPRPAAVLVPLLRQNGAWHMLLTRRTETLAEHSGQVAFPGGRMDPEDPSVEATALREAYEEVGLLPDDVEILGRLDPFVTVTNYLITPVVGKIGWPYPLQLEQGEVSRVFTIPLAWLADPDNHEIRQRSLPSPYPPVSVIYFKHYDGELLWGVSARITFHLLSKLVWGESVAGRYSRLG